MPADPDSYDASGYPDGLALIPSDAGDAAVNLGEGHRLYSNFGRLLAHGPGMVQSLARKGPVLYLLVRDPLAKEYAPGRLRALDADRGGTLWNRAAYADFLELRGDSLVGQVHNSWPMATYVEHVTPASGRSVHIPVLSSVLHTDLIGTDGNYVATWEERGYTAPPLERRFGRLTVYRLVADPTNSYPAFAGLSPEKWPDACGLLPVGKLPVAAHYTPVPQRRSLFGARLPRPQTCTYVPATPTAPLIRLSVEWTASSQREAERLLQSRIALAHFAFQTVERIGPRHVAVTEEPPSGKVYAVYIRVGTSLVRITTTPTAPALARRAAAAVD